MEWSAGNEPAATGPAATGVVSLVSCFKSNQSEPLISLCHCRPHGDETTTFTPDDSASLSCVAVVHRHIYNFRSGLALSLSSFMNSPPFSCAMGPELSEDAVVEHQVG